MIPITVDDLRYRPIEPFNHGFLPPQDGHKIYFEQVGNPKGEPVLFFHGGPGGGCSANHRRLFDPTFFNAVLFDQRGCGRSTPNVYDNPKKGFQHNNPQKLLEDAERLREHLGIEKWHITGCSWGATLGLLYAKHFPQRVSSLTVDGVYLHRPSDIDWYINGMKKFFPEADDEFEKKLNTKGNRINAMFQKIIKGSKKERIKAALALGQFEMQCVDIAWKKPQPNPKETAKQKRDNIKHSMVVGALETFYMKKYVFAENWFKDAKAKAAFKKIKDIAIMNGRHDVITPPACAYEVHKAHPHSTLLICNYGAHGRGEIEIMAKWIKLFERLKYKGKISK